MRIGLLYLPTEAAFNANPFNVTFPQRAQKLILVREKNLKNGDVKIKKPNCHPAP